MKLAPTEYGPQTIHQVQVDDSEPASFSHEHSSETIALALSAVEDLGNGHVSLSLSTPNKRHTVLGGTISSPTLRSDLDVFHHARELDSVFKQSQDTRSPALSHVTIFMVKNDDGCHTCRLEIRILWRDSVTVANKMSRNMLDMLWRYMPPEEGKAPHFEAWSPRDFYDNVHIPKKTPALSAELKHDLLQCQLLPFQRRAVRWALQKEGAKVLETGRLVPALSEDVPSLPASFRSVKDAQGRSCCVSNLLGIVTTNIEAYSAQFVPLKGGILAEEMGLGKTVELIALMSLHTRKIDSAYSTGSHHKIPSRATLIITPSAILEQWKEEIGNHAPSLKVMHYEGLKGNYKVKDGELMTRLLDQDVVLTTYNVLSKEIHFAEERPERSLRHQKQYDARKSPLVEIEWWRVCLDEAQMVESGVSNSAKVARLIPRVNAWAVSGTPLRKDVNDLFGLLLFLHYEPFCQSAQIWNRLLGIYKDVFKDIIGTVTIRHSKHNVTEDLRLPPQKRVVVTVPFTAIEEQHYGQLFQQMYDDCQLDKNGSPTVDDWDPDSPVVAEKMRTWLTRLRQTCLHPEVGGRNRRALGPRAGPLRTVMEVLEVMVDQNDTQTRAVERKMLVSQIQRGQMLENAKQSKDALQVWKGALEKAEFLVQESREQLAVETEKAKAMSDARKQASKEADSDEHKREEEEKDEDADQEVNSRVGGFRNRLRAALEIQHICVFFIANAYYQIKSNVEVTKPDSDDFKDLEERETKSYESAKLIRQEMLTEVFQKVYRVMRTIEDKAQAGSFMRIPSMDKLERRSGIENRKIIDKLQLYCIAMDDQARQFSEWREKMIKFLRQSLIDEEENVELQGDEYETSTKHQDEMYVYMVSLSFSNIRLCNQDTPIPQIPKLP